MDAAPVDHAILSESGLRSLTEASDIIINCSPVGMSPDTDKSPVPAKLLRKELAVFDIVYNPVMTKLITEAGRAGCATASGVDMFVNQAALQFELWTGTSAPVDIMSAVVREQLK